MSKTEYMRGYRKTKSGAAADRLASKRARDKKRKYLNEYKLSKGCLLCGYNANALALDFHHRDGEKKECNVGRMDVGWDKMLKEIEKCDIVCANCHRIISFQHS